MCYLLTRRKNGIFDFSPCYCRVVPGESKLGMAKLGLYVRSERVQEIESYPTAVVLQETNSISRGVAAGAPCRKKLRQQSAPQRKLAHTITQRFGPLATNEEKTQTPVNLHVPVSEHMSVCLHVTGPGVERECSSR